jgi:glycosyltransferase involved in cell wall biosynthesis
LKILVTGTRGIPGIQGGVETHCEELYPKMIGINHEDITLIGRSAYITDKNPAKEYKGIKIKNIYSPKIKSFEAIVHSVLSIFYAAFKRPDLVHIHAVGPNLVAPLARLMGLKVVMTHHGPDYERQKWGALAKTFLKLGEWSGVKFSNKVIVISEGIGKSIEEKYGRKDYVLIPNGVPVAIKEKGIDYLSKLGLEPKQYIFSLGRFVPEKGFDYLIKAWKASQYSVSYKLVIAGDADHESDYSLELKELARQNGVILTGFIKGVQLRQLFTHARLFVIPSFYEGLPIALLEAMSYGLDIVASDIPANKEVGLPGEDYFEAGNIDSLALRLVQKLSAPYVHKKYDMSRYNWENIAKETYEVYQKALKK